MSSRRLNSENHVSIQTIVFTWCWNKQTDKWSKIPKRLYFCSETFIWYIRSGYWKHFQYIDKGSLLFYKSVDRFICAYILQIPLQFIILLYLSNRKYSRKILYTKFQFNYVFFTSQDLYQNTVSEKQHLLQLYLQTLWIPHRHLVQINILNFLVQ